MQYGRDWFIETMPEVKKLVARSKAEGEAGGLQKALIILVQSRFPSLGELAQQTVSCIQAPGQLDTLMRQLSVASDEKSVRELLRGITT